MAVGEAILLYYQSIRPQIRRILFCSKHKSRISSNRAKTKGAANGISAKVELPNRSRPTKRAVLALLVVLPVLSYALFLGARGWLSTDVHASSRQTLALYAAGLEELLDKYTPLPQIYALHPSVQDVLQNPEDQALRNRANRFLQSVNIATHAADTYILDAAGLTLAASNWEQPVTFVGRNFSFRPYYQDAMKAGSGRFFALGTTSLQRGYYLAHAVNGPAGATIGVVVVKIDVTEVEKNWEAPNQEVIVTDHAGVVFLSSRPDWLYRSVQDLSPKALVELGETRRYAGEKIGRLPFTVEDGAESWPHIFKPHDGSVRRYVAEHQDIPVAGWRVWILAPSAPITNAALAYTGAGLLVMIFAVVAVVSLLERRRGLIRALAVQQRARKVLEDSANELERQVERRTRDLKRTQNELVQAGKMAALGQMSVGINHELNQPLTAIRSYAANAVKLLDQDRIGDASENLSLISALSERMSDIILRLKIFARQSSDERVDVVLQTVITNTMRIVEPRLKKERVQLVLEIPDANIVVLANDVRLEQVMVNLINNAVDALEGCEERRITLSILRNEADAIVHVRDTGPGIPADVIDLLFQPFVTTKDVGIGLGLGLSISYGIIEEFGGELRARNVDDGGAEFSFNIPLAPMEEA